MTARVEFLSTGMRGARVPSLPAPAIREGVLELAGSRKLHHQGELRDVRIAWRLTGPEQAPVVCALGGILFRFQCLVLWSVCIFCSD